MNLLSFLPLTRLPECSNGELAAAAVFLLILAGALKLAKRWGW